MDTFNFKTIGKIVCVFAVLLLATTFAVDMYYSFQQSKIQAAYQSLKAEHLDEFLVANKGANEIAYYTHQELISDYTPYVPWLEQRYPEATKFENETYAARPAEGLDELGLFSGLFLLFLGYAFLRIKTSSGAYLLILSGVLFLGPYIFLWISGTKNDLAGLFVLPVMFVGIFIGLVALKHY